PWTGISSSSWIAASKDHSLERLPPKTTLHCKVTAQKNLGPRWRQSVYQSARGPFFGSSRRVPNHLLQRGEILEVARTARRRDSADRQRAVAVMLLHDLNHLSLFQHAQMTA